MIEIGIAHPGDALYAESSVFAQHEYQKRIGSSTPAKPDIFAYAFAHDRIVASLGLDLGERHSTLFFEYCRPDKAFERLSGRVDPDRSLLGGLGVRATALAAEVGVSNRDISLAVTAIMIIEARAQGILYLGGVTNGLVAPMVRSLGFDLVRLGTPDTSRMSADLERDLGLFLTKSKPVCAGLRISSIAKCKDTLADLMRAQGITQRH